MKISGPFEQIITLEHLPLRGAIPDEDLEIKRHAGVVTDQGKVIEVGDFHNLKEKYSFASIERIEQPMVLIPGFVDCHTHIAFGGSRAQDYALRVAGKTYLEIASKGGGIWDTVRQTRKLSLNELKEVTLERANKLLKEGCTTIEVKSGYGLSIEEETKLLEAIYLASKEAKAELISTCLAAHIVPKEYDGKSRMYLEDVLRDLLPVLKHNNWCHRIDVFTEQSAFSVEDSLWYLQKAKDLGFDLTVHADQFTTGGSTVAMQLGARSADHLEASGATEIKALGNSETVAVVLPGASLGLGIPFAPARKLLDAGAIVAIASDWNPGSAPMGHLLTQASILGAYEHLSITETLAGMTFRAAKALGLEDRGQLCAGQWADMQAYPTSDYREIFYLQGSIKPVMVWKNGQLL
jgi:imidazolonepropionase